MTTRDTETRVRLIDACVLAQLGCLFCGPTERDRRLEELKALNDMAVQDPLHTPLMNEIMDEMIAEMRETKE